MRTDEGQFKLEIKIMIDTLIFLFFFIDFDLSYIFIDLPNTN